MYQLGFQKAEAMLKAFKAKVLEEKTRFSDAEIMNFLNLDDATYKKYLAEIEAKQKED